MILFGTRAEDLKKEVLAYIGLKIDEHREFTVDSISTISNIEGRYVLTSGVSKTKAPIEELDLEHLCDIADQIHTPPAKDLSK
jgi:hypothetical protein